MSGSEGFLEWIRSAVAIDTYEAVRPAGVRLFYLQGLHPRLAEVEIVQSEDAVTITLYERVVTGTYADGSTAAEPAVGLQQCVEIALDESLGERSVVDGSTGRHLAPRALDPEWREYRIENGCPRWIADGIP